jgi:DNA-binding MarR family transcriptional regulator
MGGEQWEATLDRILELTVLLSRDMADSLAGQRLTESRAHLVWQLQQRGPCTQATLAAALHVTPRTITALVDGLVETGFVTREPHPSDRRATLVTFTKRGSATAQALVDDHRRLARQLFADLPDDTFENFDAGLLHVITQFRGVLAERAGVQLRFSTVRDPCSATFNAKALHRLGLRPPDILLKFPPHRAALCLRKDQRVRLSAGRRPGARAAPG